MIKQIGFQDYINANPSLKEKITYEEIEKSKTITNSLKDDGVEDAYNGCMKVLKELEAK